MHDTLVRALFRSAPEADACLHALRRNGVAAADVSVVLPESVNRALADADTTSTSKAAEGAGVGAAIGGTALATIAAVAAIGSSLALPGVGLVVAGPVAAALAGAGAGGLAGTMVGALVGAGIPEEHVSVYEAGLREGGVALIVRAHSPAEASTIEALLQQGGAERTFVPS
jgi:hypothetical protein